MYRQPGSAISTRPAWRPWTSCWQTQSRSRIACSLSTARGCYDPPVEAPDVAPLPAEKNGYITFGSANQISKVTDEVIALWAEVMRVVPDSRLYIKTKAFKEPEVAARYMGLFGKAGIAPERLKLEGPGSQLDILRYYNHIDIALDTFPCAGGTTTCEALWMGVPVITLMGERFCNRHSASHMQNAGITDTTAESKEQYIAIVTRMAADIPSLSARRQSMRTTVAASPLCDAPRFAKHFAGVLRQMWNA
ncbi:MAG: hypothetical protein EB060_07860 [Proteobacteria bacterium]|nr:hypothetical protein [Pseudomonadota bacterium]